MTHTNRCANLMLSQVQSVKVQCIVTSKNFTQSIPSIPKFWLSYNRDRSPKNVHLFSSSAKYLIEIAQQGFGIGH
jgi:hypothetical protein